jgi:citrate lyase subunit beta/citryl-CoA lyase
MTTARPIRPRRSTLYVPGSNHRALARAPSLPADAFILDLEDAVLPEHKVTAREAVAAVVHSGAFGPREVAIRCNPPDSTWGVADLRAAAASGAHAAVLPKVATATEVARASAVLDAADQGGRVSLWLMAETPTALLDLRLLIGASARVEVVVLGTADLGLALRLPPGDSRTALVPHLARAILEARASGVDILDGVYPQLADSAGLRAECAEGRALGFDGKTLIHPGQIAVANEIFGVAPEEAAAAERLIAAWSAAAEQGGSAVAVVNGRMVERLHVEQAERRLALFKATGS